MRKIAFILLSLGIFTSCESNTIENINTEETIMQENENIIDLVKKNDLEGVKKNINQGINVDSKDHSQRSLLLIATINKQEDMARLLVSLGANVNLQDNKQDSPFLYAGATGQTDLVKLFINNGARFDIYNRYGGTALIPACERGHIETVKLLVNTKNFPINHVNRLGWTGLMEAIILGDGTQKYQEIVQILKDGGADLSIPDNKGITPLQHAESAGYTKIVQILKS